MPHELRSGFGRDPRISCGAPACLESALNVLQVAKTDLVGVVRENGGNGIGSARGLGYLGRERSIAACAEKPCDCPSSPWS
jgi:hypothetical protein